VSERAILPSPLYLLLATWTYSSDFCIWTKLASQFLQTTTSSSFSRFKTHMREVTTQGKPFEEQFQNHERNPCFSTIVQRVRASLWKENPTRGLKCRQHTFSFFFTPEFGFQTTLHNTHKASASQGEREREPIVHLANCVPFLLLRIATVSPKMTSTIEGGKALDGCRKQKWDRGPLTHSGVSDCL
jgi:hypothetical protein